MPTDKTINDRLKSMKTPKTKPSRKGPLWGGPEKDGITFSLLSRFLNCRERFRALVVEGLKPAERFYAPIDFGSMWHVCEEYEANSQLGAGAWEQPLMYYCQQLCKKFPFSQEEILVWYEKAKALFPVYVDYWSKHSDVIGRTPLLQEQPFDVPYKLPSGRIVRLRGKWDSVDLIGTGIYIQENKTKSSIDEVKLSRQLTFDLQTMIYCVALVERGTAEIDGQRLPMNAPLNGVRYNVIRRAAHKTADSMMKKVNEDMAAGRDAEWFARWNVTVTPSDIERFRQRCLDPILEQLCAWWEHIQNGGDPFREPFSVDGPQTLMHWQHPFGVYNSLDEGGSTDLDQYLTTGSEVGLLRTDDLFPELK